MLENFIWGRNGQQLTPEMVAAKRRLAEIAQSRAGDTSPVGHWTQGAARVVDTLGGVLNERRAARGEEAGLAAADEYIANDPVLSALIGGGGYSPAPTAAPAPTTTVAEEPLTGGAGDDVSLGGQGDDMLGTDVPHDHSDHAGQSHADWLTYRNQSAIRNQPLSQELINAMSFLPDLGVRMEVFSGGETPDRRASDSGRHLHGNAADADFHLLDGTKLVPSNPEHLPILQEIVRRARANGITGFGEGADYMGEGRMHIGFGTEAVWGAGGRGANAPEWLREAYYGAPAGETPVLSGGGGQQFAYGGQGDDTLGGGYDSSGVVAALSAAMSDPWVAQKYGPVIQSLLGQEMRRGDMRFQQQLAQSDPMYQAQLAQLTAPAAANPWAGTEVINGQVVQMTPDGPVVIGDYRTQDAPEYETRLITMPDGSEVMVERIEGSNEPWMPSQLPEGGTTGAGGTTDLTESQAKTTLFSRLQEETAPVINQIEEIWNPANMADAMARNTPIAGNFFTSEEGQMYASAAAAWAEGALRISTGAAATQPEIERNMRTYFAQPGDTPAVVEFKRGMREMYNRAIQASLGQNVGAPSLKLPEEFAAQYAAQNPPPQVDVATQTGVTAQSIATMSASEVRQYMQTTNPGDIPDDVLDAILSRGDI